MRYFFVLLLISLFVVSDVLSQDPNEDLSHVGVIGTDWSVFVNLKDYKVVRNLISYDGKTREILVEDSAKGIEVIVYIEPAKVEGDHITCRSYYHTKTTKMRGANSIKDVKLYEDSTIAYMELDIPEFAGKTVNYHSLHAYQAIEGYWVDVHVSKEAYTKEDKSSFDNIINTMKVNRPKVFNFSEQFMYGTQVYTAGRYDLAVEPYDEIIRNQTDLINSDKVLWITIVEGLAFSAAMTAQYEAAIQIYEYGISLDPDYPMFYYEMARVYAYILNFEEAMDNLEKAFSLKNNMINGETIPNPRYETAYTRYIGEEKFEAFLKKEGF